MSNSGFAAGRGKKQTVPDKVDMSLDDIIRLNRKEQQQSKKRLQPPGGGLRRPPLRKKGGIAQGAQGPGAKARHGAPRNGAAGPRVQKAAAGGAGGGAGGGGVLRGGVSKLRPKRGLLPPHMARRRAQVGVVTGLASRRPTSLQRGFQPANRSAYAQAQRVGQRLGQMGQRTQPFVQRPEAQYQRPQAQRRPYRGGHQTMDPQQRGQASASPGRRPFQLRRRPLPPAQQAQRDSRQATFLSHRGLKVHTQVQKQSPYTAPVRTRQWRNSAKSNGLLTVSIDNPTARTQPEPPTAWSLHPPPAAPAAPLKLEPVERKTPKGVPLQFDINSVAKPQTAMTLNERFRILKDQRVTAQGSKGSRFVTVS